VKCEFGRFPNGLLYSNNLFKNVLQMAFQKGWIFGHGNDTIFLPLSISLMSLYRTYSHPVVFWYLGMAKGLVKECKPSETFGGLLIGTPQW
jgi:hypothetical protein